MPITNQIGDFDRYYSDEPFSIMDKNQRDYLDPTLITMWRQRSVFRPLISYTKNLGEIRAKQMTVTELVNPHPDTTPLAARQIWMPSIHVDSKAVVITFEHNGSKIAYHKYDDMITYWEADNQAGLRRIAQGSLGFNEVDINDMLARNALISGTLDSGYNLYMGGATDFSEIGITDAYKFDVDISRDIWLGMTTRGVASAQGQAGAAANIFCFTSPSVIYDIQGNSDWVSVQNYNDPGAVLNYEVGTYKNVRFVQSPKLILWNTGTITARAPIILAINAGDGAPNPVSATVDNTYAVGQGTSGITNYVEVGPATSGSFGNFEVNDIITFHKTTTDAYGVTDGVAYNEGTLINRRIISKTASGNNLRLTLDIPIMLDYNTDLGGGVYGYITKARNIHASIFIGGPQAIVAGVAQPARFYSIPPIDDFLAIHRFSWDQYLGYQTYRPEVIETVFSAGTTRYKGAAEIR